jgi:hypothetical protein
MKLSSALGDGFRAQGNGASVDAAVAQAVTSYNIANRPLAMGLHIYHPRALYETYYNQAGEYINLTETDWAFDMPYPSDTIYALDPEAKIPGFILNPDHSDKIEQGFLFPIDSDWDSFLIRFYKPTADACIRIASVGCLPFATIEVGQTVEISGVGSSDGDPSDGRFYLKYWWDKDIYSDTGGPMENYVYGQSYEYCIEDCDRDNMDTTSDDPDVEGDVWEFTCEQNGLNNMMLWIWDSHHTNNRSGWENLANNLGNHLLHL